MPIRYVIFDMDGVLVDVSRSYRRAIEETAAHFTGRPVAPGTVQRFKNQGGFNDDWRLTEAIVRESRVDIPFEAIVEEFDRRYRGTAWNGYIVDESPLIGDVVLNGLASSAGGIGIATGRPRAEAEFAIRRYGWTSLFSAVVPLEDQAGRPKPDPFPLLLALQRLGEAGGVDPRPDEAIYVGDSVDDMRAARSAGMRAIGFEPPYLKATGLPERLREAGAHEVIDDHALLPDLLERSF